MLLPAAKEFLHKKCGIVGISQEDWNTVYKVRHGYCGCHLLSVQQATGTCHLPIVAVMPPSCVNGKGPSMGLANAGRRRQCTVSDPGGQQLPLSYWQE